MIKHNQNGAIGALVLSLITTSLLLVAVLCFSAWAFTSRQDYKNNVDKKIAAAVTLAKQQEGSAKDKQFAEAEKQPLKTYEGPQAYGSLNLRYPKTWSGYVDDTSSGGAQVDGYFQPGVVPSLNSQDSTFALRVQVLAQSYSTVLNGFKNQEQSGTLTAVPYSLPKVPNVIGVRLDGQIRSGKTGSMVILPLRDKTIEISTEGSDFGSDFTNIILPNLSFAP